MKDDELYTGMKNCTKCLLPETQETVTYDEKGICSICRQIEYKKEKIDWTAREKEFKNIIEEYRGKGDYDCIIPFSGGKDSTFTLYKMVKDYNVKPLVVSYDHGFFRPRTIENVERVLKKIGVDYLRFRPNWKVVKKLILESLIRKGDFCWQCHTGIFAFPMHIAVKFKIPLVIWGEPSAEYTSYYSYDESEEVDERRFNRFVNLGITAQDMIGMVKGVTKRDLLPFTYPPLKDLCAIKYRSICLGSYIPWDPKKYAELIKRDLGWRGNKVEGIPTDYDYEKVECRLQGVRDYLKFIKRGFGRTAHLMSLDLRNNRINKQDAIELIRKYDGYRPASLDYFLKIIDMSEDEFMEIALKHVIAPHKFDKAKIKGVGKKLEDQDSWNADL